MRRNNTVRSKRSVKENEGIYSADGEYYEDEYRYVARNALDDDEEYRRKLKRRKMRGTGSAPSGTRRPSSRRKIRSSSGIRESRR